MTYRNAIISVISMFALALTINPAVYAQSPVIAPAGAQAPTAQWLASFDEFTRRNEKLAEIQRKMQADLQNKTQKELDSLRGLSGRLLDAIPQGYQFDSKLRLFLPIPPPPTAPTQTPAPSPTPIPTPATTPTTPAPTEGTK